MDSCYALLRHKRFEPPNINAITYTIKTKTNIKFIGQDSTMLEPTQKRLTATCGLSIARATLFLHNRRSSHNTIKFCMDFIALIRDDHLTYEVNRNAEPLQSVQSLLWVINPLYAPDPQLLTALLVAFQ